MSLPITDTRFDREVLAFWQLMANWQYTADELMVEYVSKQDIQGNFSL